MVHEVHMNAVSHRHAAPEEVVRRAPEEPELSVSKGVAVVANTLGGALRNDQDVVLRLFWKRRRRIIEKHQINMQDGAEDASGCQLC